MKVITPAGVTFDLGATEEAPSVGIIDYSRRETDDYGVTKVVQRDFSRRMSVRLSVPFDEVDTLQQRLASLRATAARWVADDRFACLSFDGFYKEFDVDLNVPPVSWCTMTVEGLAASDPFTDPGDDPAPDGRSSTLQVLKPTLVTDGMLTSNVPEADYPQWAAGTTYPLGARVLRGDAHRIFESVLPGNLGHDPAADAPEWIDIGPTNRWAMFDRALGSVTSAAGAIVVTLAAGAVDAVAVLDVKATTVRVQAGAFDKTESASNGAVTIADIPASGGPLTVTIAGPGQVEVGTLLIGRLLGLGITEANAGAGITDYSRKEVDEFGEVTIVERAWAKRMTANGLLATEAVDLVFDRIAAVRALPCLWIGQDGLQSLSVYGFFREFSIELGENVSKLSLSIEGLSTAGKVAPLTANVDWPNVGDPDGTKPADNATRNVNRGDWAPGVAYNVGDFFQYGGSSYTVITAHVSAANLPPPNQYVSLLASVGAEGDKGDKGDPGAKGDAGSNGAAGEAAITPSLTTPAYQVWAYANGIVKSYDGATTTFVLKQGGDDISASFNMVIAANPNGLQVSLSGRTATVVGATGNAGEFGNTNVLGATLTLRAIGTGAYVGRNFDLNFTLGKLLGGYEIVSALPTTNNFEGREVFNNTDGKRYTYTGGVWRATITDASVIADSQIAGMSATKLVGTVDTSKLGVGVGGNRLVGAVPATRPDLYMVQANAIIPGATYEQNATYGGPMLSPLPNGQYPNGTASYTLPDLSGFCIHQTNSARHPSGEGDWFAFRFIRDMNGGWTSEYSCEDGKSYEFSVYMGAHRCPGDLIMAAVNSAGAWVAQAPIDAAATITSAEGKQGGTHLGAWKRCYARMTIPPGAGATRIFLYVRKYGTDAGQGDSWLFMCYPQLAETVPNATSMIPYSPPPQAIMVAQNIYANSLTSEVIAANAIGTDELAARTVTAKHLTMMDFENLMVDGDLASGTLDGWSRSQNGVAGMQIYLDDGGAGVGWPSRYALHFRRNGNANGNELTIVNGRESFDSNSRIYGVSVQPNDEFAFEAVCWADGGAAVYFEMVMRADDGSVTSIEATPVYNMGSEGWRCYAFPGTNFTLVRCNFRNSTGKTGKAFLRAWGPAENFPNSQSYVWNMKLRRRNNAQLIVDGSVLANHIAAGQVQTDHLGAGSVIASKIAVTELSAITANIGLMRTATTGKRTEIDSNGMRAYDPNGTMRMRGGVWSV